MTGFRAVLVVAFGICDFGFALSLGERGSASHTVFYRRRL
jgi:hypothetical protein